MANTRIKDISTAATTLNSDDFIAVDGSTAGTRKMAKADLISEVSSGVSGTYLEESNNLSDVASLDTSKLNMEIPDVGTAPNEVPLNGQLGTMAYQDADGVSMGTVEAESLEVTDKITTKDVGGVTKGQVEFQDSGYTISGGSNLGDIRHDAPRHRWYSGATVLAQIDEGTSYFQNTSVGIGTATPGATYKLDVSGDIHTDAILRMSRAGNFSLYPGSSNIVYQLEQAGSHLFKTDGSIVAQIDSSANLNVNLGNLVFGTSGKGIDFGSAATSAGQGTGTTGSVSNSVLSDYEFGSWTPTFLMSGSSNFAALTMDVVAAQYVKVGRHVHCQAYIRTDNVDTSGATGYVTISGLPFVSDATSGNNGGASIHNSARWTNAPTTGNVPPNTARLYLQRNGTTGVSTLTAADLVNGAAANQNEVVFTASYIAST